jgi:hypothetical protein
MDGQAKPKLLPPAEKMTPAERKAYERETLAKLEQFVDHARSHPTTFNKVREIRLEGSYPETVIFVRWLDTRDNTEKDRSYPLWVVPATGGMNFEYAPDGQTVGREPPAEAALLIWVWVGE